MLEYFLPFLFRSSRGRKNRKGRKERIPVSSEKYMEEVPCDDARSKYLRNGLALQLKRQPVGRDTTMGRDRELHPFHQFGRIDVNKYKYDAVHRTHTAPPVRSLVNAREFHHAVDDTHAVGNYIRSVSN
jgi:hypothetical protein